MYRFSCCICGIVFERKRTGRSLKKYCSNACIGKANGLRTKGIARPLFSVKMRQLFRERQNPNFNLSVEHFQYFAGFLDAEGTISHLPKHIHIILYNTHRESLLTIQRWLNFGKIYERRKTVRFSATHFGCKPIFLWHSGSNQLCKELLVKLLPFLRIKREKALRVLGLKETEPKSPMSWPYIAAFFDGEGSVSFYDHSTSVGPTSQYYVFSVINTHIPTLNEIRDFLGFGKIHVNSHPRNPSRKPIGNLRIARHEDQIKFCEGTAPYMLIKKDKVTEAMNWIKSKDWFADNTLRNISNQEIVRKYTEVQSIRKVAASYNVTYNAIWTRLMKMGAKMRESNRHVDLAKPTPPLITPLETSK